MSTTGMSAKQKVLIVGESPLVEEYASLCQNKGFAASVRMNPVSARAPLPLGVKRVTRPSRGFTLALELTNIDRTTKEQNLAGLDKALGPSTLILSTSVTVSVEEQSSWVTHPGRLVGLGALPSLLQSGLLECAGSFNTTDVARKAAEEFCRAIGKEIAWVSDSVGMVLPRILSMLVNEACFALAEKVATGADIDTAMKLGTNYPAGPVEWAAKIGVRQIHAVVNAVYHAFLEDRYRPSPLLTLAAQRNALPGS